MNDGSWSQDQRLAKSAAFLKSFQAHQEEVEEDLVRMDYTSKQVEGLRKKYQTITSEISTFMVEQGQLHQGQSGD